MLISGASVNAEHPLNKFAKAYVDSVFTISGESGSIMLPIGPEAAIFPVIVKLWPVVVDEENL